MLKITKLIIADDHLLFTEGLENILDGMPEFEVIGKVANGKVLIRTLNSIVPDIILMDINMPVINGLEAAAIIRKSHPEVKIVFVSMYCNDQLIDKAKMIGASGFLMKDITAPVLKESLLAVRDGKQVFIEGHKLSKSEVLPVDEDFFMLPYKLSPRELEIIKLIKNGFSTKRIAQTLDLSVFTVETHRKNINRKMKVKSPTELMALLIKQP